MIVVHCGCSYTSSPIHTVEIVLTVDMHIVKHNHSMLEGEKKPTKNNHNNKNKKKKQLTLTFKTM